MNDRDFTRKIIGCAFKVHNTLGPGFLEKIYENALGIELQKADLSVKQQEPISVLYEGRVIGDYFADLLVDDRLIIEIKAVLTIATQHEVQLVNYLSATGIDNGLLINFGPSVQVKHKFREYKPKASLLNAILQ